MPKGESGGATAELALLLPLLVVVLIAIGELAVVARTQLELINAAREGARVAAVSAEPADAVAAAQAVLGPEGDRARVAVVRPQVVGEAATVRVSIRHRLAPFLFGGGEVELAARAAMRVER